VMNVLYTIRDRFFLADPYKIGRINRNGSGFDAHGETENRSIVVGFPCSLRSTEYWLPASLVSSAG